MGMTRVSGRNARSRTSIVLALAVALGMTGACASTVAGTARPVADRTGIPTASVDDTPRSSGPDSSDTPPSDTPPSDTPPSDAQPDTTSASTSSPGTTASGTGVPGPVAGFLRKKLGADAGIADAGNTRVFTFAVTDIDPDFPRCVAGTPKPERGHLIGVRIEYEVLDTYTPADDGQILLDRAAFRVRDAANIVYDDLDSPAAQKCLTEGLMPDKALKKGDRGAGWVLLDAPTTHGVVQLTQASVGRGGWEWVIPGG